MYLEIASHIKTAIFEKKPVVALESTIISHGMPYPANVETALVVEACITAEGAIPATIAVINGRIKIGLTKEEIVQLGDGKIETQKLSRRDLPFALSAKKNGSTTVAATMICAQLAGIKVFATGGIGGVHRHGEVTLDVSADLQELARTNVAVVCAGAKAILDIGRTLEMLETLGVPVVGYQTQIFPAFYYTDSGFGVDCTLDDAKAVADLIRIKWQMGLQGGVLVAVTPPVDTAMSKTMVENMIEQTLLEADERKIKGKELTPFLLNQMSMMTEGQSLLSNIALIKNNAQVAAKIARSLA